MKDRGVTQSDLAEHFDMTPGGMQKWLSGAREPSVDQLLQIAAFLKVPAAELLLGATPDDDISDLPDFARDILRRISSGARRGELGAEWFKRLDLALEALAGPTTHSRRLDYRSAALGLATALDLEKRTNAYGNFVRQVDEIMRDHGGAPSTGVAAPVRSLDS